MDKEKNINLPNDPRFTLVKRDTTIHDAKLETKPTTFLKDAIRRFGKNKSSVAGAIILGILILMSLFVPVISNHNIDPQKPSIPEKLLEPKVFEVGTGWWDGTRKYEHQPVNPDTKLPSSDFVARAITTLEFKDTEEIDTIHEFARGGSVMFENQTKLSSQSDYLRHQYTYFNSTGGYKATFVIDNEQDVYGYKYGSYTMSFTTVKKEGTSYVVDDEFELTPVATGNENEFTIDISSALSSHLVSDDVLGGIRFNLKGADGTSSYMLLKSLTLTADNPSYLVKDVKLEDISFSDANLMVNQQPTIVIEGVTTDNPKAWLSTGRKGIRKAVLQYCDFVYDTYEAAYGDVTREVALSEFNSYIKNQWMVYTSFGGGPKELHILDDSHCPVREVYSEVHNEKTGELQGYICKVSVYRYLGYTSMPKFIFGTDAVGHDIFVKAFKGLQVSLLLGLITAAVCLAFGLVWGSISGYFGGNVDIAMERFCEILSGIPWIVMMTLCILHLGNNFATFVLALCLTGWMGTAGTTRTQFYRFKSREYVLASRTLGANDVRLIFRHILPNALGTIVTGSVFMIPSVIYSEATLAYLNLGLKGINITSFGIMMSNNQVYLSSHPNLVLFPAVVITLMMISFNLFGNGLRDALNPTLKGSE